MSLLFLAGLISALIISFLLNRALHSWLFPAEPPLKKAKLVAWSALGIAIVLGSLTMGLNQTVTFYPLAIGVWYLVDARRARQGRETSSPAGAPADPALGLPIRHSAQAGSFSYRLEERGVRRVTITHAAGWEDLRVRLDGKEVLMVPSRNELENGCQTTIDRGELKVQLQTSFWGVPELRVSLNGRGLPGSPGDPGPRLEMACRAIYLLAGASVIAGLLGRVSHPALLQALGFGWSTVGGGLVLAGLGWLVQDRLSMIALGLAIGLCAFGGPTVLSFASQPGILQLSGGMVLKVGVIAAMAQGFGAIQQLRTAQASRSPTGATIRGQPPTETPPGNQP